MKKSEKLSEKEKEHTRASHSPTQAQQYQGLVWRRLDVWISVTPYRWVTPTPITIVTTVKQMGCSEY